MDTRFLAFVVALICIFASNNSEGKRKLADNGVHWDALLIDKDKAERVWNYCRQELKDSTEAVKSLGLELPQSRTSSLNGLELDTVKRIIHTSVVDLPPNKKEKFLDCLREKKSPLQISTDEGETSPNQYQKLFSGWISIPRRFLRSHPVIRTDSSPGPTLSPDVSAKAPIHEPPVHSPSPVFQPPVSAPEPSYTPSDIYFPPKSMENDSPLPTQDNNDTKKYVIIAACASLVAGLAIIALFLLCCMKKKNQRVEPKEGQRDEKPLLNFSTSDISAGSSEKSHIVNPNNKDFKATSSAGGYADASQANSEPPEVSADGKTANLPLPPGRTAPPPPPPGPPPPPPKPPAPVPPPLPKVGRRPPNPPAPSPLGPHHRRSSTGEASAKADDDSEAPKTKLKPFFWDKVLASPDHSMVWHEIKAGSFQFNEEMMESLFGYVPADKNKNDQKKDGASSDTPSQFIQIIDPKKSQNLAILLKALNVTTEEVCDALNEGNELPAELIQTLLRMAPTADEELKLRLYSDDVSHLGPAERFLKVVVDIPFAFKRLESLLFVNTFQEEYSSMKESFETLEVACKELRNSRLFLKLLEAVLKTGNRMNDGTYRGGAQAFKLDTLLKLSDVKGTDGKTTLLHFVVQEIIRGEGLRAARRLRESPSISSVKTEDLGGEDHSQESEDYYRSLGLQVVAGLSNELQNVKKAAIIDNESLSESVFKLRQALVKTKEFLDTEMKTLEGENEFRDALASFTHQSESDIEWLIEEDKRIMALVRSTGDYFHGKAGRDECKHLFVIVRDFLLMVDKACLDIKNSSKLPPRTPRKENLVSSPTPSSQDSPTESPLDIHRRLFPAMRERQMDDDSSSDDEK